MKKSKCVHLTTVHLATDARIFHKECRALADAGYDVVLIAPGDEDREVYGVCVRAIPGASNRLCRMIQMAWRAYRQAVREHAEV